MTAHTHHLPGRLRLRFSRLKQQRGLIEQIVTALRGVPGVASADGNAVTGGILIHYDTQAARYEPFWRDLELVLLAHHLEHDPRPLGRQPGTPGAVAELGQKVAAGVAKLLVDKLVERSAVALVAAFL